MLPLLWLSLSCKSDDLSWLPTKVYNDADQDPVVSPLGMVYSNWRPTYEFDSVLTVNDLYTGDIVSEKEAVNGIAGILGPDGFYIQTWETSLKTWDRDVNLWYEVSLSGNTSGNNIVPATDHDGNMYLNSTNGLVHAFDINGDPLWITDLEADGFGRSSLDRDGRLFVLYGEEDYIDGFAALDKTTGEELWRISAPSIFSPVSVANDGALLVVSYEGEPSGDSSTRDPTRYRVRCFEPEDGSLRWEFDPRGFALAPLVTPDGDILLSVTSADVNSKLILLDSSDGSEIWTVDEHSYLGRPTIATKGRILVGCDGELCQLSLSNGNLERAYGTEGYNVSFSPAIVNGWIIANADGVNIGWDVGGIAIEDRGWPRHGADSFMSSQAP